MGASPVRVSVNVRRRPTSFSLALKIGSRNVKLGIALIKAYPERCSLARLRRSRRSYPDRVEAEKSLRAWASWAHDAARRPHSMA